MLIRRGIVVQSVGFARYLPVGRPDIAARFLDSWGIDEIIAVDIEASREGRLIDPELVRRISESCFVPVTAGGGVRTIEAIRTLLESGADKITVNRLLSEDLPMVEEASRVFGAQCIVASVDARRLPDGGYGVFTDSGRTACSTNIRSFVETLVGAGVGEVFLNSIDRDGRKTGYDMDLVEAVAPYVDIPVIIGGAGTTGHLRQVLDHGAVAAAAAANLLHFTEHSVSVMKSQLRNEEVDVRGETHAAYRDYEFDANGRILKKSDAELLEQVFEYIPPEVI